MLLADSLGTGNAHTNDMIYLFPDKVVAYEPDKSSPTLVKGNGGMSVSWSGG